MAKKLLLHVGDPKTGSSSIQRILYERRFDCSSVRLDYPDVVTSLKLARSLLSTANTGQAEEQFRLYSFWLENSTADVAVISAEQFSTVNPARLEEACREHFQANIETMSVLAYAKPHMGRFISAYSQRVKVGQFGRSVERLYEEMAQTATLHMHKRFSRWRAAFGEAFRVRPMVRGELFRGDVVADFLNVALEGADFTIEGNTEANVSLPVEALAGLRMVHAALRKAEVDSGTRQAIGDRINTLVTATPKLKGTKLVLDRALAERFVREFSEDAKAMDQDFLGSPIMVTALDAALSGASAEPVPIEASAYFRRRDLMRLRKLSGDLAELLREHPHVWERAHRRDKGRKPHLLGDEKLSREGPKVVATTHEMIAELAEILAEVCTT